MEAESLAFSSYCPAKHRKQILNRINISHHIFPIALRLVFRHLQGPLLEMVHLVLGASPLITQTHREFQV